MKKRIQSGLSALLLVALCLCFLSPAGIAEGNEAGYTARAILPDNQLSEVGYFHLLMQPGQKQVIEVEVINHENKPLAVTVEINGAYTNQNGLITYTRQEKDARTPFEQIPGLTAIQFDALHVEDGNILIAPLGSVRIPIQISMPEQGIGGALLGGIVITKVEETPSGAGASFAIRSLYSYAFALQLQTSAAPDIMPEFALRSVAPASIAGWDAIAVSIENTKPVVVAGAMLSIRVETAYTGDTLLAMDTLRVSIAPNTTLPYTVSLPEGASLAPGAYTVSVDLTYNGATTSMQAHMVIPEAAI